MGSLAVAVRPDDDVDGRVERVDTLDDEPRSIRLGDRDDDQPSRRDTGHLEHLAVRRVAVDRHDTGRS